MAGADGGGESGAGDPGFGEVAGGTAALPDMRDTPPTFENSYGEDGEDGENGSAGGESEGTGEGMADRGHGDGSDTTAADTGAAAGSSGAGPGTRAEGGLETFPGSGVLTAEEQVAILDGQLEQSTSDFDGMILEEQARQREATRERANQEPREQPEPAGPGTAGRNPYEEDVAVGGGSVGGGMGGVGRSTNPPDNPAIYAPPEDIPDGRDDDVVARQLREAAMREPDPEIRERLWGEYRKYKGIESPTP